MKRRIPRTATSLLVQIASRLDENSSEPVRTAVDDSEVRALITRRLEIAAILADLV